MKICVDPNGQIEWHAKQKYEVLSATTCIVFVKACKLSPLILSRIENIIWGPEVNKRPYWFMWECKKASLYAECYSLSSLYLTMVAELKDTVASKYLTPPALLKDKYSTWRKEMKIWELVTSLDKTKRALLVFLSLEGTAREAVLELDTAVLNSEDGMKKLYEKLDTLFLEDVNQSAFRAYEIACKKNPHVIVSATEIKSNSSFFNKDANTTLLNDMNATRLHFDSSDSVEGLNSKRKKRETLIKVTMNRGFAWRWLFWERCLKEKKLPRSLGYQLTHKLPTP